MERAGEQAGRRQGVERRARVQWQAKRGRTWAVAAAVKRRAARTMGPVKKKQKRVSAHRTLRQT